MAWALAIGLGVTWIVAELELQTVVGGISFGVIAAFLSLADTFQLLMERGVFVDLFQNKAVC